MDKYIKRSLKIVSGEWLVDNQSFNHALNELKERVKQLTPLFNECCLKGISIQEVSPELNEEWNLLLMVLRNLELLDNANDSLIAANNKFDNYKSFFNKGLVLINIDLVEKYKNKLKELCKEKI